MSTLFTGKRIKYSTSASSTKEAVIAGCVLMRENKEAPVISGYAIVHDDGTIDHIAYWKLKQIIGEGNTVTNTAQAQGNGAKKKDDYPF